MITFEEVCAITKTAEPPENLIVTREMLGAAPIGTAIEIMKIDKNSFVVRTHPDDPDLVKAISDRIATGNRNQQIKKG